MILRASLLGTSAALVAALALSGCTQSTPDTTAPTSPSTNGPETSTSSAASGSVLHATPSPGATVLKTLDNQSGTIAMGPFPATRKFAYVYLTCNGSGRIDVDMGSIGTYPLDCDDVDSLNQFQLTGKSNFTVTITAQPGQKWAMTLAEGDAVV
ncbi:hypothetical protein [Frondihabitans sp. 762G35]|uniref:hypothetical protein n=1 Tax=Frondihabitans sp. 762G35 TaxID=1446794 RepID=UPI000E706BBF|nr:hypothetical protein [Frondihabitans sp. 762G35]